LAAVPPLLLRGATPRTCASKGGVPEGTVMLIPLVGAPAETLTEVGDDPLVPGVPPVLGGVTVPPELLLDLLLPPPQETAMAIIGMARAQVQGDFTETP
jgi:hypothetical protein